MTAEKLGEAKITSKMQITLPKKVQQELNNIELGQYLIFYKEGDKILVKKGEVKPL